METYFVNGETFMNYGELMEYVAMNNVQTVTDENGHQYPVFLENVSENEVMVIISGTGIWGSVYCP